MSVLTDYFRAADAALVVEALERTSGGPLVGVKHPAFDGIEARRVVPCVELGMLIAAIQQVSWNVHLVDETIVWPTTPAPGPDGPEGEDDPWVTGPWVSELDTAVRDALAGVHDADVSKVVAEWVRCEELRHYGEAHVKDWRPFVEELIQLARRARSAGEQLYCWQCL